MINVKSFKERFEFGNLEFCIQVHDENVENVWIFSDLLNADFIQWLIGILNKRHMRYRSCDFMQAFDESGLYIIFVGSHYTGGYKDCNEMLITIKEWLKGQLP